MSAAASTPASGSTGALTAGQSRALSTTAAEFASEDRFGGGRRGICRCVDGMMALARADHHPDQPLVVVASSIRSYRLIAPKHGAYPDWPIFTPSIEGDEAASALPRLPDMPVRIKAVSAVGATRITRSYACSCIGEQPSPTRNTRGSSEYSSDR
jgi:hypothetical protein